MAAIWMGACFMYIAHATPLITCTCTGAAFVAASTNELDAGNVFNVEELTVQGVKSKSRDASIYKQLFTDAVKNMPELGSVSSCICTTACVVAK